MTAMDFIEKILQLYPLEFSDENKLARMLKVAIEQRDMALAAGMRATEILAKLKGHPIPDGLDLDTSVRLGNAHLDQIAGEE